LKNGLKMTIGKSFLTAVLSGSALVFYVPAHAQFAPNSSGPTNLTADSVDYRGDTIMLKGQVDVRRGETRILSDNMDISTAGGSDDITTGDFQRVVATGNFYYLTPDQEVRGTKGIYEKSTESFTVTGDVILLQGEDNVVTGDKLVYDLDSGNARVVGSCKGRKCGRKGRVNILIKNTDAAQR